MSGITVAERTHWRDRIAKRINQRIETLVAKQDPTLLQRVAEQARDRAYVSLGIEAPRRELEAISKQKEQLEKRVQRLEAEQRATVRGTRIEEELEDPCYGRNSVVDDAVSARAKSMERDLLAESDLGNQILTLRREKENLLDTVWLATSNAQIKELWEQVNAVLEQAPTPLEEKALKIAPVQET
jgi:hypothetical protein